jgi:integron integrase
MRRIIPRMPPAGLPNSAPHISSKPKLLDEVRAVARMRHLSLRTEQAYTNWIRRFILFHKKRHPAEMNEAEIREFISDLAVNGGISASTQTVALSALLFLYRDVLKKELPYVSNIERAQRRKKLPVVFARDEVRRVLTASTGTQGLIARMLYGSGLRLMECLRLRVKDLDFTYGQVIVRDGKGEKDRVTMLPESLKQPLERHLKKVKLLHEEDLEAGYGEVHLPYALARKYPRLRRIGDGNMFSPQATDRLIHEVGKREGITSQTMPSRPQ